MLKRGLVSSMSIACVAAMLVAPPPSAATEEGEDNYTISIQMINGSGCPTQDTVVAMFTEDKKAFTLTYNAFEVRGGESKNCQLGLKVHVPAGESFSVKRVQTRGNAYLLSGARGRHTLVAYFTGRGTQLDTRDDLDGPYDDIWESRSRWPGRDWSPCNQDHLLNINDILRVTGTRDNYMNMFSTDIGISTVFSIETKACS
jgi:hypothetical protein